MNGVVLEHMNAQVQSRTEWRRQQLRQSVLHATHFFEDRAGAIERFCSDKFKSALCEALEDAHRRPDKRVLKRLILLQREAEDEISGQAWEGR